MRRSIKRGLLLILESGEILISDLLSMMLTPYSPSIRYKEKLAKEIRKTLFHYIGEREYTKKGLRDAIYSLKKDGLISRASTGEISITTEGRKFLSKVKKEILPIGKYVNSKEILPDKSLKIIIFDIPEKERRKRDWLRSVIKNLGFRQLQQSVWAGNNPIPEDFIEDLNEFNLLQFVEIFSVGKRGTIEKSF
jgi:phenylacetic acid degradation operon negative regulatory protein